MSYLSECCLKHNGLKTSPAVKELLLRNLDEDGYNCIKYRNIPVTKSFGGLKTPRVHCENVSGAKELKNIDGTLRNNSYQSATNSSLLGSNLRIGIPKKSLKLDCGSSVNTFQRKLRRDHTLPGRICKRSLSEPALAVVKAPGGSTGLRDLYREDTFLPSKYLCNEESVPLKNPGVQGILYLKNAGKVYKSTINTENLCMEENDVFCLTNKEKYPRAPQLGNLISKSKLGDSPANKLGDQEGGDFEIAIFLSGLQNVSESKFQMQDKQQNLKTKMTDFRSGGRKTKKMKQNVWKRKALKIDPYDTDRSSRSCLKFEKSNLQSELSSRGSDSDFVFSEIQSNRTLGNATHSDSKLLQKDREASRKSDTFLKRDVSKPKLSNIELCTKFESSFRSYASTDRHSGEVIPKKISTIWMTDAGIVDKILTEKEANEAFKHAAGTKITMNTEEYKEFLIMLSLRRKLPCYEIYHRMCGMYKEDKTF